MQARVLTRKQQIAVLSTFDHLQVGLCIVLDDREVVLRNAEADRILESHDAIQLDQSNRLVCWDSEQQAYKGLAVQSEAGKSAGASAAGGMLLVTGRESDEHSVLVELTELKLGGEDNANPVASLVKLTDLNNSPPVLAQLAVAVYGLTAIEGMVCQYLSEGFTTREIADKRGVSYETIRSQVKSVLHKTRCQRRSDLIRLLVRLQHRC